jgi:hypothetical protein
LKLADDSKRYFSGYVSRFSQTGSLTIMPRSSLGSGS